MAKSVETLLTALREEKVAKQRAVAQLDAKIKHLESGRREQRLKALGRLVDEAGLADWEDTTLAGLFGLLATLAGCPNPIAVLEGVLSTSALPVAVPEHRANGTANAQTVGSGTHASGDTPEGSGAGPDGFWQPVEKERP